LVRIRVKLGGAEAEVEADQEHIKEVMALVPDLLAKLPPVSTQRAPPQAGEQLQQGALQSDRATLSQLPTVTLDKSDSLADVIEKFFADPWGRERRKLSEVREALQSYGLNYPKQSVAVALLRLAKSTKIRRFKAEDREFVYTASASAFTAPAGQNGDASIDAFSVGSPS
jgi:hypothetical protein